MEGELLLNALIEAVGLPETFVKNELDLLMQKHKICRENLTLDQLRPLIAELVQDTLLENKRALKPA
jgi:hypothetical protein